jgi:hypothetical protein
MTKKTFYAFASLIILAAGIATLPRACAGSESFPILSEKDLAPKLVSGTKTLKDALAVQMKTPNSRVEARGEYFSWFSQCVDFVSKGSSSPLWEPCLRFSAQLLRVETSGETAAQLVEPYKKQRQKWDETVKRLEDADRLFLNQEAEGAVALSSESEE